MPKYRVIYHGNCADGFTSAWIVKRALGNKVSEFFPGVYGGKEFVTKPGDNLILVDFSYPRAKLEEMGKIANSILILDHHKTAQTDLNDLLAVPVTSSPKEEWQRRVMGDKSASVFAGIFDMSRSGAQITWDFFNNETRPAFVDYVGDRDLWKFQKVHSKEISTLILSYPYTFKNWDTLNSKIENEFSQCVSFGEVLLRKHTKDIDEIVNVTQRKMKIGGYVVPVANLPYTMGSDGAAIMCKGKSFAAYYFDTADGRSFGLRSDDDGIDVSEIAKKYGGGGHAQASGFRVDVGWEGE